MDLLKEIWDFLFSVWQSFSDEYIAEAGIIGSFIVFMVVGRKVIKTFRKLIGG